MKRPKLLILVRHAESMRNKAKARGGGAYFTDDESRRAVKGIPDHKIPLTPEGIEQSIKMEGILKAFPDQTKKLMQIRENPFIRERHAGYTYDMTNQEAEKAFPWLKDYWETFGGFFGKPPGGESLVEAVQRVHMFINMLFNDRVGEKVLVVTHGGTLRCFRYLLEHWTYDQALAWPAGQEPKNCGVTIYKFDRGRNKLLLSRYNQVYY